MHDVIQELAAQAASGQGYIIFSTETPDQFRKGFNLNYGDNIGLKDVYGVYKGEREHSFLMNYNTFLSQPKLHTFIKGQESIVLLSPAMSGTRRAAIVKLYEDGTPSFDKSAWDIGTWTQISREKAKTVDHTYDPSYGTYWTIVFDNVTVDSKELADA